jgi:hypothetical protein
MHMERPDTNVFQFNGLNRELEMMQSPSLQQQPPQAQPVNWAADFMQHQHQHQGPPQQFDEFEKIYQQGQRTHIVHGKDIFASFDEVIVQ